MRGVVCEEYVSENRERSYVAFLIPVLMYLNVTTSEIDKERNISEERKEKCRKIDRRTERAAQVVSQGRLSVRVVTPMRFRTYEH